MDFLRRLNFNIWYFSRPPWDTGISPPELFEFISDHPAGRAIDIGCGTGTNVITLAQHGWQVTGIDFAPRAIHIAKRKTQNIKADLFIGDATQLKGINGPFDLALDMGCFHGVPNKADYLTQLDRILAPNGFWLLYGFFKPDPNLSGPGLVPTDIASIQARGFHQLSRQDGMDKRERPSAWFLFQKM